MWYVFLLYVVVFTIFGQQQCVEKIITNPARHDGFGAQFQTIIYSVIYAELNNKKFVYTPFKTMEHNYDSDQSFLEKKEWLINFKSYFKINKNNAIAQKKNAKDYIRFFEENLVACIRSCSLKKIKKIFKSNKRRKDYFNNKSLNVAIHIRRFNQHDTRDSGVVMKDYDYLNIINHLRIIYSTKKPLFHLYSQGDRKTFSCYKAKDVILHLNEYIEDTFASMVFADVLVASPSSFSYIAGILSDGIIYYVPFWHKPLPHWIPIDIFISG